MAFSEEDIFRSFWRGVRGRPGSNETWEIGQTPDGLVSRLTWTLIAGRKGSAARSEVPRREVGSALVAVYDRDENVCWLDPRPLSTRKGRSKVEKLVRIAIEMNVDARMIPATEDELKAHARRLYERWKERHEARR